MEEIQKIKNLISDIDILSNEVQEIIIRNRKNIDTITRLF